MRDQEIIGLMEAYSSIYTQPQELTEEVEIAAHYFYEMGLNEDGVDILIEELGVEEFAEFVYDIAEEYTLTEATRLQSGGAKLKGPKGSRPQSTTVRREKKQGGLTMNATAAPASTISPRRIAKRKAAAAAVAAAKEAQEKQPEKKGGLGGIADRVREGMKRHNQAMSDTGETLGKAAKGAGKVARGFASGLRDTVRFTRDLSRALTREEVEEWVNALVEEGYDLSEYTWDDMCEMYMNLDENRMAAYTAGMSDGARASVGNQIGSRAANRMRHSAATSAFGRRKRGGDGYSPDLTGPLKGKNRKNKTGRGQPVQYRSSYNRDGYGPSELPTGSGSFRDFSSTHKEEFDLFDVILEHLVAEGYADTNEAALAIMANMSEEWKQDIMEISMMHVQLAAQPRHAEVRKAPANKPSPVDYAPAGATAAAGAAAISQMRRRKKTKPAVRPIF